MKNIYKIISLVFLAFIYIWVNAEYNPDKVYDSEGISTMSIDTYETTDMKLCTMQYAPVCGEVQVQCIKAPCYPVYQTFWNACMANDNKIIYEWECEEETDTELFNKLKVYDDKILSKLEKYNLSLVEKAYNWIDDRIEKTKMLKIVDEVIVERVTIYTYLKYIIWEYIKRQ